MQMGKEYIFLLILHGTKSEDWDKQYTQAKPE